MSYCEQHHKLLQDIAETKTDVKWLVNDRLEQKERYENNKSAKSTLIRWLLGSVLTIVSLIIGWYKW